MIDKESERESYASIVPLAGGSYKIDFEKTATIEHCGFGAEFPRSIVVKRSTRKCAVSR